MGCFGPFSAVFGHSNPIYFAERHKKWSQISPGGPLGLVLAKKHCPTFISSLLGGEKSRFGPFRTIFGHSNPIYFALRHKKWSQISPGGPLGLVLAKKICPTFISSLLGGKSPVSGRFGPFLATQTQFTLHWDTKSGPKFHLGDPWG